METLLGIAIGIGLSAACGFRVFVPLLVMNLMALSGHLHLSSGFAWIESHYATAAFATATILEVLGYYIPWVDHILDIVATPAAVIAGTVATASMADISRYYQSRSVYTEENETDIRVNMLIMVFLGAAFQHCSTGAALTVPKPGSEGGR